MPVDRGIFVVAGMFFLSFLYALINYAVHDFSDSSLAKGTALLIMHSGLGALFFLVMFIRGGGGFLRMVRILQGVIAVQAVLIILYFVSMDFRQLNLDLVVTHSNLDPLLILNRARGFAGSYGASLGVFQSLGLLFTAYLFSLEEKTVPEILYLLVSFVAVLASVIVTGRTGLLMVAVVVIYFLLIGRKEPKMRRYVVWLLCFMPFSLLIVLLALKFGVEFFPGNDAHAVGGDRYNQLLSWIFGEVFVKDGSLQSQTLNVLKTHLAFPSSPTMIMFGDPSTWSVHRVYSDIGWIRILFGGGVVGMMLYYGAYVAMFVSLIKNAVIYRQKVLYGLLATFFFVIEFKEPFLMNIDLSACIFLFFLYSHLSRRSDSPVPYLFQDKSTL